MVKRLTIALGVGLLVWWAACEFKLPTTPRMPSNWGTRFVLPLLDQTYRFCDLIADSTRTGSRLLLDTLNQRLYMTSDTGRGTVGVPAGFDVIPEQEVSAQINLAQRIRLTTDSLVIPFNQIVNLPLDSAARRLQWARLTTQNSPAINQITLTVTLSDSFPHDIQTRLIFRNAFDPGTAAPAADSVILKADSLTTVLNFSLAGDSLFGYNSRFLDQLRFEIGVSIADTFRTNPASLNQQLTVSVAISELAIADFQGRLFTTGWLPAVTVPQNPGGATGIQFNAATLAIHVNPVPSPLERVALTVTGVAGNQSRAVDFYLPPYTVARDTVLDIASVWSILPDSLKIRAKGVWPEDTYLGGQNYTADVTAEYTITIPCAFILPESVTLTSRNATLFQIADSTIQRRVGDVARDAEFDLTIENYSPFEGTLALLVCNANISAIDTVEGRLPADFYRSNDSLFHVRRDDQQMVIDTQLVVFDTLLVFDLPAASFRGDTVISAGRISQLCFADADVIAQLTDSTDQFIRPQFRLVNPTGRTTNLRPEYWLKIRSYLNLYLEPAALTRSGRNEP